MPPSSLMHPSSITQYGPPIISELNKDKNIQCSHWLHDTELQFPMSYLLDKTTNISEPEPEPKRIEEMPKATAVTSLHLRRQTRQHWNPETLSELLALLPSVQELLYEPWRDWRRMNHQPTYTRKAHPPSPTPAFISAKPSFPAPTHLLPSLLTHLRHLTILSNFHGPNPPPSYPPPSAPPTSPPRTPLSPPASQWG